MKAERIEPTASRTGGLGTVQSVPAPEGVPPGQAAGRGEIPPASLALADARRDLHELQALKAELEAQNEELRRAKLELEEAKAKLDSIVRDRTAELEARNARLEVEIAERKRAEERYRAVVEDQTELISRHRPDGGYLFVNQAFCRFFGKTHDELIGSTWHPVALSDDVEMVEKKLKTLTTENRVVAIENRVISGSGEVRWVQFVNRGFFDEAGKLTEFQVVGRDISQRKMADDMLLVYAREVHDLYNHAPCGYHSLDRDGYLIRINDTELGWLGYSRHEVIGVKHFTDLVTLEGAALFNERFPRFLKEGAASDLEFLMVRKDGSVFPVIITSEAVTDADGRYLMSRSTIFDNTERKKAEELRRRSEQKFRDIFENSPIGIFQTGFNSRILSVNPSLAAMFGYQSPSEMVEEVGEEGGGSFFVDPGQRASILKRALERGNYERDEVTYRRRDGSEFVAQVNLRVVQAEGGRFLEGFVEDITSRKEAQRALLKSELQFRQMAEAVDDVFWLTSPTQETLEYVSPAFEEIWGRPLSELYANPRSWMDAILPEDVPQVQRDLQELAKGASVHMEYRIRRPDGTLRWVSDRGFPLFDESGQLAMVTGVVTDLTKRKKTEEALRKYARRLIVLEEDLRKRIAMELHDDIGQVLTALGLNLAHIGTRLARDAGNDLTSVLDDSRHLTKEISRSVRNLMVDLRPSQLDEYGLAAAIRSHAEQFAQRSGIHVELQADPDFPRLSVKREIALFRITQEALNNASKHAAATRITVSLFLAEGTLRLAVSDDGDGFVPQSVTPTPSGSGWGLTIMRERAELVGGRFSVESTPGQGTTVAVEIRRRG